MKFIMNEGRVTVDSNLMRPAFVKGVVAAHEERADENPYTRKSFREDWQLGYKSVKNGALVVEDAR